MKKLKQRVSLTLIIVTIIISTIVSGSMIIGNSKQIEALMTREEAELCLLLSTDINTGMVDENTLGECIFYMSQN